MSEIDLGILEFFLDEATDALKAWEQACLDLEKAESVSAYESLFRCAHNLKGASRSVGLTEFGGFVHEIEDLITQLKEGTLPLTGVLVSLLLDCQTTLSQWLEGLRENPYYVPDTKMLSAKIKHVLEQSAPVASGNEEPESDGQEEPPTDIFAEESSARLGDILIQEHKITQEQLEKALRLQNRKLGEVLVDQGVSPADVESALKKQKALNNNKSGETIRIAAGKLDELIQLIGELSIHQSIIWHGRQTQSFSAKNFLNAIYMGNKITKDLQSYAISLRMQPLEGLFQRLDRVARDVARQQNKKLNVVRKGIDVNLDKAVIERITEPLIHIIRNAVDHGIEDPEARKISEKVEEATVEISGVQDAGGVSIIVSDDGRGLDPEKIFKRAVERGLISPEARLTTSDINNLIMLSGFSTAEKVTDISGRGVGMDVVKNAVEELNGTIHIHSEKGKGSTFTVSLPTSLSIVDALIVEVDQVRYAVPMQELAEVVDLSDFKIEKSGQYDRMISLRGEVVPLESLGSYMPSLREHKLFGKRRKEYLEETQAAKSNHESRSSHGRPALIVVSGADRIAFEIDGIVGQQQVFVRKLSDHLANLPGLSGGTILGDGEPGMIISLPSVAKSYLKRVKREEAIA